MQERIKKKQQASEFLLENMGENSEYVFMHEHVERGNNEKSI